MTKLEFLLREWGDFNCKNINYADELGENILYAAGLLQGRVQEPSEGHRILCPDTPPRVQKIDRAVHRLPELQQKVLFCQYAAPLREDGNPYTVAQLSRMLRINKGKFRAELRKARKKLSTEKNIFRNA